MPFFDETIFSRRLLALALCLLLLLAFLPTAHAADTANVTTEGDLQREIENAPPNLLKTIYIDRDITIHNTLTIYDKTQPGSPPGAPQEHRIIKLTAVNGAKLIASNDFNGGSMFNIGGHTELTIDCEIEGNGKCSIVSVADDASLTLTSGADLHGGSEGVSVNGAAKFSMTGGSVRDNSNNGISVNSSSSDIRISGGSIENNGTGVYVGRNSHLALNGGTFSDNTNDVVIGAPTQGGGIP